MTKTDLILTTVIAKPGISVAEMSAMLNAKGLDRTCVSQLALGLHRSNRLERRRERGKWRYWPAGAVESEGDRLTLQNRARAVVGEAARAVKAAQQVVTSSWLLIAMRDESLVVIHKDTDTGFRLDAETVAAIRRMG